MQLKREVKSIHVDLQIYILHKWICVKTTHSIRVNTSMYNVKFIQMPKERERIRDLSIVVVAANNTWMSRRLFVLPKWFSFSWELIVIFVC